jgi:hypothetical protein
LKSKIYNFAVIVMVFWLVIDSNAQALKPNLIADGTTLVVMKKSKESKKASFRTGDRIHILTKDKNEKKGKIMRIDSLNIYFKKDIVSIEDIYSITKKPSAAAEVAGIISGGVGMILVLGSLSPTSSITSQEIKTEALISGGVLTSISFLLLYRKTHNHKKWIFEVIK